MRRQFLWLLPGVVYVLAACAAWVAVLAGLAEITSFLREKERPALHPEPSTRPHDRCPTS